MMNLKMVIKEDLAGKEYYAPVAVCNICEQEVKHNHDLAIAWYLDANCEGVGADHETFFVHRECMPFDPMLMWASVEEVMEKL